LNQDEKQRELPLILVAEDDPDDRYLIEQAFHSSDISENLFFVKDGEELLDFLLGQGQYAGNGPVMPACLLLDLKMPRKDGREALREIRQHPDYRNLPIIIVSTSDYEQDKKYCAELGVTDYMTKPDNLAGLMSLVERTKKVCIPPSWK
jgi:CheY-like chemotaxis protein